ncbi:hypothetical protein B0T20DRAFT_406742 [Sordaria brevicollis]|uniref:Uncharacterized protein n=1 Tax=Sordaria brevicollis TaxID=83679 RepID=A0AAE0UDE7_SORBR|nr:hypothetical protein B0T20DRAFT_406742 [Sordaria brevicollis]
MRMGSPPFTVDRGGRGRGRGGGGGRVRLRLRVRLLLVFSSVTAILFLLLLAIGQQVFVQVFFTYLCEPTLVDGLEALVILLALQRLRTTRVLLPLDLLLTNPSLLFQRVLFEEIVDDSLGLILLRGLLSLLLTNPSLLFQRVLF